MRKDQKWRDIPHSATCYWPNCKNYAVHFVGSPSPDAYDPSQWCNYHFKKLPDKGFSRWIKKFEKGKLGLPKDRRKYHVLVW